MSPTQSPLTPEGSAARDPASDEAEAQREDTLTPALAAAARIAVDQRVGKDAFMQAAWDAYLDAKPGLRDKLADKELRAHLKRMRKQGMIGQA